MKQSTNDALPDLTPAEIWRALLIALYESNTLIEQNTQKIANILAREGNIAILLETKEIQIQSNMVYGETQGLFREWCIYLYAQCIQEDTGVWEAANMQELYELLHTEYENFSTHKPDIEYFRQYFNFIIYVWDAVKAFEAFHREGKWLSKKDYETVQKMKALETKMKQETKQQ